MRQKQTDPPAISVIIGTYNQLEVLKKVLIAYETQDINKPYEIVVVDSSSSDGTTDFLKHYRPNYLFTPITIENNGKAVARNQGVAAAKSDLIFITDSDMIPDEGLLTAHVAAHRTHVGEACFEGLAYNLKTYAFPPDPQTLSPQVGRHPRHYAQLGWYYFLTGNLSFPKTLFETMGGFDTLFTGYGWEDLELGYRLSQKGIPLYYLHTAINYHFHIIDDEDNIRRCYDKGQSAAIFLQKHPELRLFLGLNPVSHFLARRLSDQGMIYTFIEKHCLSSTVKAVKQFGIWFLREYHYLQGLLDYKDKIEASSQSFM